MFALVQVEDFDQGELYARLKQSADEKACGNTGAIVTFTGLVRDFNISLIVVRPNPVPATPPRVERINDSIRN